MGELVILIVEDDPISLAVASLALRQAGYATRTANHGVEALEILQTLSPDLILSDIQMPHMDGFELARRARQMPRLNAIPMVAFTALASKESEKQAYDAGFTGYIAKPVNGGTLAARVKAFLERPIVPFS